MEENTNVVNDTQGVTVEPQTDNINIDNTNTTNIPVEGGSEPTINNSQSNEKPTQDKDTNNAFAAMRKARESAEQKALQLEQKHAQMERDFNYFQRYAGQVEAKNETELKSMYGHMGINTWEDVDRYYEAQEKGIDPEVYKRVVESEQTAKQALERLAQYENKEKLVKQAEEMAKDPRWGNFFNANKDSIIETANKYNVDLTTARLLVLEEKFEQPDLEKIKADAVKEHIEAIKKGNLPVEHSGGGGTIVTTSPKTFADARKGALAIIRASKQ
jgi:hypothetical protein